MSLQRPDGGAEAVPHRDIRKGFHHDLDVVRNDIVRLASVVTEALGKAVGSPSTRPERVRLVNAHCWTASARKRLQASRVATVSSLLPDRR